MLVLAYRLRKAGVSTHFFYYSVTFERWQGCLNRLERYIHKRMANNQYIVVTHSLGSVLARAVYPKLALKPEACFFLAPPVVVCEAAKRSSWRPWYRILTGDIGQLLANQNFMSSLPVPDVPVKIYAGNSGFTGIRSPFGMEPNDGVLMVRETVLPGVAHESVPSFHTFIMNNRKIAETIIQWLQRPDVKSFSC